ncbi:MAG: RDD family protein [Syntrophobacteraceae bacterium]
MHPEKTKVLGIRTPEGVEFSLHVAGPISRFLAYVIDAACIFTAAGVAGKLLSIVSAFSEQFGMAIYILTIFIISVGYGIILEWFWRGQTVGKRLLRLRVMDERGLRLNFSQIVVRNLLRAVDSLPVLYLVGGVACLLSPRGQRVGDLAASTIVVRNPETFAPNLEKLIPDKYNSLHEHPHLAARLRSSVTPEEAFLALRTLLRRDGLDPAARVSLFSELAAHFKSLVRFPQEALEGVTDERYIRNVVDIIFRPPASERRLFHK